MKIRYEFADGTVSEVEVEESIGAVIIEDRRQEDNLATAIPWTRRSSRVRSTPMGKRRKRGWNV